MLWEIHVHDVHGNGFDSRWLFVGSREGAENAGYDAADAWPELQCGVGVFPESRTVWLRHRPGQAPVVYATEADAVAAVRPGDLGVSKDTYQEGYLVASRNVMGPVIEAEDDAEMRARVLAAWSTDRGPVRYDEASASWEGGW